MKVKSESEVTQLCPTPSDPMDCSPPGSSVHGIFQARVLEWGAFASSETKAESWSNGLKNITLHCLNGEGNGNSLQYSCLENPKDGGA